jgi:hypothetical protein
LKLEYLVLVPNHDSFCNTKKAFIDFLKVDSLVDINGQTLSYRRTAKGKVLLTSKIRVETELLPSEDERYFLIVLEAKEKDDVDLFSEIGEKVKSISMRLNPKSTVINTIWNDVGRHYSQTAYPIINEIENMMRKLISKFMLINVGTNWSKDAVHPDLFKKIEGYSEEELYSNDLYKLDFIHLADVLFKKKRDLTTEQMDRLLQKTDFNDVDKEAILRYIPKSNWDKHFTSILDGDGSQLEAKWNRLYKLRNKVAHNRFITKAEYGEITGICSQVKQLLTSALNKLGEIDLDVEERESVVLSYQSQSPAAISYMAEKSVAELFMKDGFEVDNLDLRRSGSLDFIAVKDAKNIGVYVTSPGSRNLYPSIKMLFGSGQTAVAGRMNRSPLIERLNFDDYEKVKVYYVLRNLERDGIHPRSIQRIKEILNEIDPRIEVVFGYVDEDNSYQTIEL